MSLVYKVFMKISIYFIVLLMLISMFLVGCNHQDSKVINETINSDFLLRITSEKSRYSISNIDTEGINIKLELVYIGDKEKVTLVHNIPIVNTVLVNQENGSKFTDSFIELTEQVTTIKKGQSYYFESRILKEIEQIDLVVGKYTAIGIAKFVLYDSQEKIEFETSVEFELVK